MTTNLFRNRLSPQAQFSHAPVESQQTDFQGTRAFCRGLASNQTDIYRDKFGWKWKVDSEILPSRIFVAEFETMQVDLPETTSKIDGPLVRQFSVFLPNKVGAMLEVVKLLNAHATHVVALSVSESTDAAIARIIVSDPERVEELFRENNVAFGVCELMVVELREVATQFIKILAHC